MNPTSSIFFVASLALVVLVSATTLAATHAQNDTQSSANQSSMTNATGMNSTSAGMEDESVEDSGQISRRPRA